MVSRKTRAVIASRGADAALVHAWSPPKLARFKSNPTHNGRVAALGHELWEVIQRHPDLGFRSEMSGRACIDDRERGILWDRQTHLENSIPMSPAQTAADALAQLVVASSLLSRLVDNYPGPDDRAQASDMPQAGAHFQHEHEEIRRVTRNLERCLYSIRRYLEASAGLNADDFGARFYMSNDDDPFQLAVG